MLTSRRITNTVLAALFFASAATAATTTHTKTQGSTATLYYENRSPVGVRSFLFLWVTSGQGTDPSLLNVFTYQVDPSGQITEYLSNGGIPITRAQFTMNSLQSATLHLTGIMLEDFYGLPVPADINVTWAGVGTAYPLGITARYTTLLQGAESAVDFHIRSSDTVREATAGGSVVINGIEFLPAGGTWAGVLLTKFSYVEVAVTKP
jgi:hypothetical protein